MAKKTCVSLHRSFLVLKFSLREGCKCDKLPTKQHLQPFLFSIKIFFDNPLTFSAKSAIIIVATEVLLENMGFRSGLT